jgi:integrase
LLSTTRKRRTALDKAGAYIHQHAEGTVRSGMYFVKVPNGRSETGAQLYRRYGPFPETPEGLARAVTKRDEHLAKQKTERKQTLPLGRAARPMTLAQWIEVWLGNVRTLKTATTFDNYSGAMRRLVLKQLGGIALADLTKTRIEEWRNTLLENHGAPSVNYALKRLKTCLQAALHDEATTHLKSNPAWFVELAPEDKGEDDYEGDPSDMPRMLAVIGESYMAALPLVATDAGLRRSEAAALHWRDVDWDNKQLILRWHFVSSGSKTHGGIIAALRPGTKASDGEFERVELSEPALEALRQARADLRRRQGPGWKAGQASHVFYARNSRDRSGKPFVVPTDPGADEALVFPSASGMPYTTGALGEWFRGVTTRAGINKTLHGLRHDCGSFLLANNVPLTVVSKHLRHANVAITAQIYSHMLLKDKRLGADTFGALWGSLEIRAIAV